MAEVGSGPAAAVEASSADLLAVAFDGMMRGATDAGLPDDMAAGLVRQTALGTALLLTDHPGSPADLKDQVASPAGTTIKGLAALEDRGVRGAFIRAVEAAAGGGVSGSVTSRGRGDDRMRQNDTTSEGQVGPSEGRAK